MAKCLEKIDESGWSQEVANFAVPNKRGGRRPGAGRKKSSSSNIFHTVGLTAEEWEFLSLWSPGNFSDQLRELLYRSKKFWPAGPARYR